MSRQKARRLAVGLFMLVTSCVLAVIGARTFTSSLYAKGAFQQQRARIIERLPVPGKHPLVIVEMKVKGRPVLFGQRFEAGDEWMKDLVITVRNTSDKVILLALIQLQFPRPPGIQEKISVSDIPYGNRELEIRPPTDTERLVGVFPGEKVDMRLTSKRFHDMQQFLAGTGYASSIESVRLRVDSVIFGDDTMWKTGSALQRDPGEPGRWNVVRSGPSGVGYSKFPDPNSVGTPRRAGSSIGGLIWPSMDRSLKPLFSHASSQPLSRPQETCFRIWPLSIFHVRCRTDVQL